MNISAYSQDLFSSIVRTLLCGSILSGAALAHEMANHSHTEATTTPSSDSPPPQAEAFRPFASNVRLRWDDRFLFVESNGLPSHNMMVGITNWQQQVPLPQDYTGSNAWSLPLKPVPAKAPISVENRFLRGAIALAVNGIPIFNPRNNRGEISYKIGELDEWGGHCGRADDYHYHIAPLHLESVAGKGSPIAYALDGYPLFGLTEPDGSKPVGLDREGGHTTLELGYHYHASTEYPYVIGGFHGEVIEKEGQVDPQPSARPIREALQPLRGAVIKSFARDGRTSTLDYEVSGEKRSILYTVNSNGLVDFEYQNGRKGTTKETYTQRPGRPPVGGAKPPREQGPPSQPAAPKKEKPASGSMLESLLKPLAGFVLESPAVLDGGNLPAEFTGDGAGSAPPLAWKGAPMGTRGFALIMDHKAPGNEMKSYWVIWNIPAAASKIEKDEPKIGNLGVGFRGQLGYEPPHSKGPGPKTYTLTLYALSESLNITQPPEKVTREVLIEAMTGKILATASLRVVYTSKGGAGDSR